MTNTTLKVSLVAATVALSLLAPAAQSQAAKPVDYVQATVGQVIAAQGNAALRAIRAEMLAAVKAATPQMPARARVRKASAPAAPAAGGGTIPATAACAE